MSYSDFKKVSEVTTKFGTKVKKKPFIGTLSIKITQVHFTDITEKLNSTMSFTRLLPAHETYSKPHMDRVLGMAQGKIWMSEDFNAPLPEEIQRFFEYNHNAKDQPFSRV